MSSEKPEGFEDLIKRGDAAGALALLQAEIRKQPGKASLRIALFQLLCVLGQWPKALAQLEVAGQLDASALAMVQTYREAIACELQRVEVFAGQKVPLLFGEPEPWAAMLVEALLRDGRGEAGVAQVLRDKAFEQAPASPGTLGDRPFEWIADADMRLGPMLEAIINGKYYWVPFCTLSALQIEPPTDLRDLVWAPANLLFQNGGETVALIPNRYVGTAESGDASLLMARQTVWDEAAPGVFTGLGQRLFSLPDDEVSLLEVRRIDWLAPAGDANGDEDAEPA